MIFDKILKKHSHAVVIGDVHGMYYDFMEIINDNMNEDTMFIGLGDYIDYGPYSLLVMDKVVDLFLKEKMIPIIGNHDDKMIRWLNGNRVKISGPFSDTVKQYEDALGMFDYKKEYYDILKLMPIYFKYKDFIFTHAAYHPKMEEYDCIQWYQKKDVPGYIIHRALYGETDGTYTSEGFPTRLDNWFGEPEGKNVFVGHHIHSFKFPVSVITDKASVIWNMDTGCGKGGKLSSMKIKLGD